MIGKSTALCGVSMAGPPSTSVSAQLPYWKNPPKLGLSERSSTQPLTDPLAACPVDH